jgi:hypothetical protein
MIWFQTIKVDTKVADIEDVGKVEDSKGKAIV